MLPLDLSPEDYEQILSLLPALYLLQDLAALPTTMMRIAAALIPNLCCTYNELRPTTRSVLVAYEPEEWRARLEPHVAAAEHYLDQHPVYAHVRKTGDGDARAISDFLPEESWRHTGFASTITEPIGIRDTLVFCLVAANASQIFIALNRGQWGFSTRDKQVANLLRSHFTAAYNNSLAFTESQALASLAAPTTGLSRRESEVLEWLVQGKTNSEIGQILSISVRTVEKHVEMIYRKLGVETRTGAILRMLSHETRTVARRPA